MLTAEQKKLVEDNQALIFFSLKKFNYPAWDFYDLAAIGLCKAAEKYDPEKGSSFATYAIRAIHNELSHWKKANNHCVKPATSIDEPLNEKETLGDLLSDDFYIEDTDDVIFARECLKNAKVKDRHKAVFAEWAAGKTLEKIANERGCSRSYIQHVTSCVRKACKAAASMEASAV